MDRSWAVLVARVALLVATSGAVTVGLLAVDPGTRGAAGARGPYACPMHADVRASGPDRCPVCGMSLERLGPQRALGLLAAEPSRHERGRARRATLDPRPVAAAWRETGGAVAALLYEDEVAAVAPEEHSVFVPSAMPDTEIQVTRTADPPTRWDRSLWRLVFRLEARDPDAPRPRAAGWVKLLPKPRDVLVVPSTAVLEDAAGPYVLTPAADRASLVKRSVEVGEALVGSTVIASGLAEGDEVATGNAFFLDADRRLRLKNSASSNASP